MDQERIVFAHELRGIASVSVLFGHYFGTFFALQPDIAHLLGVPPLSQLPRLIWPLSLFAEYPILAGQFGVGVFFIISGFVIPFSIENNDRLQFVVRRMFRIYPVYIVGFLIAVLSIWALDGFFEAPFPYSMAHIAAHFGVLTRGLFSFTRIDGISWTLEIELCFYLVVACVGSRTAYLSRREYLVIATLLAVISACCMLGLVGSSNGFIGIQIGVSLLLVVGLSYHSFFKGRIEIADFTTIQVYISALIIGLFHLARPNTINDEWMLGYLLAMVMFAMAYRFRKNFPRWRFLSHLSDISYPLYVVHALFGYVVIYAIIRTGASVYVALGGGILASYLAACLLHSRAEKQSISISKKLTTSVPLREAHSPR